MRAVIPFLALLLPLPAQAEGPIDVDVELVLAVDVSRSMSPNELELQRRGYAEALASDDVAKAITSGIHGKIAITYVEWAGRGSWRTIVPWTTVASQADARGVAAALTAHFDPSLRRTSISGAIDHGADLINSNNYRALRRVIDISGDGPNNQGGDVTKARDKAVDSGIVINGLPLMTREGRYSRFHLEDLDDYYRNCVIGGPGSFVIPVNDWKQFPAAVRQKLVLELAGKTPEKPVPVQRIRFDRVQWSGKTETGYDCQIGEKIWQHFWGTWDNP